MEPWVTLTEAETLVAGYPVTVPDNFQQWINYAFILLSKNTAYTFPDPPTEDTKLALSLYACILGNGEGQNSKLQPEGVTQFRVGNFSQTFSDKLVTGLDKLPEPVASLLSQYRTGKTTFAQMQRTYPRN